MCSVENPMRKHPSGLVLLCLLGLLTACDLFSPPQPNESPSPVPSVLRAPTHTPTPSWPTPLPTPTAAPPLNPDRLVGTFFFFWYNCPRDNCDPAQVYAIPPGWAKPLGGDDDPYDGLHYSSLNQAWYVQELRDMHLAGIDVVLPVSWGDSPYPWFQTAVLENLVQANRQLDEPLRIGLFDDCTSEASEYRDYADNGEFDSSTYLGQEPLLDLYDPIAGYLFYDRKIKPFFQTIPQDMWATHDGRPVEQGGRPLIVTYTRERITHLEQAGALWTSIKAAFQRDFHDRNGQPITPWLVLDTTWFDEASLNANPSIAEVADGRYVWGVAVLGPKWHTTLLQDYTVASVSPGFDNRTAQWAEVKRVQRRDQTLDGQEGDPGTFLRWSLAQVPEITNLVLIETWNELWEGTNVCRASYPAIAGQPVRGDYYINLLSQLLRGQELWWAAQPLPPSWYYPFITGWTYDLLFPVLNSGTRTWSQEGGERLLVSGDIFPDGYEILPDMPVHPEEVGEFTFAFNVPNQPGAYTLTWQMVGPEGPFGPSATWTIYLQEPEVPEGGATSPPATRAEPY